MSREIKRLPRIAQRKDTDGSFDDIAVEPVDMFRMEKMDEGWWLACYLPTGQRISWFLMDGELTVQELPSSYADWDAYEEAGHGADTPLPDTAPAPKSKSDSAKGVL